jgi:4-hydroxybenzoate polyprenyltransferase
LSVVTDTEFDYWLNKVKKYESYTPNTDILIFGFAVSESGFIAGFGLWYNIGLIVFCGMLVYQQSIVKPNDLSRVNLAFMTANGIASVVFSVFVIIDLFVKHKL